jgi:hypothetical protein
VQIVRFRCLGSLRRIKWTVQTALGRRCRHELSDLAGVSAARHRAPSICFEPLSARLYAVKACRYVIRECGSFDHLTKSCNPIGSSL